jgi:hypothetical protein
LRGIGVARWVGYAGLATATSMTIGAFRNVSSVVAPVAALNNNLLPLWLIVLGAALAWPGVTGEDDRGPAHGSSAEPRTDLQTSCITGNTRATDLAIGGP